MEKLLQYLNEQGKERSLTQIVSTQGLRQGMVQIHSWSCFLKNKTRAEIIKWVLESMRPFSIIEDKGFKVLMKTGRPEYYIPSCVTVAQDVKHIFKKTRERIAQMLKVKFGIESSI